MRGCGLLVETGREWQRGGTESSSTDARVARETHRNKAYYKSIQEDPVQIDVNSVKDVVDWRWNGRCVRPLRMYDVTDAYGFTGWGLKRINRVKSRRCAETTMSTYAKSTGDHFFPPCGGFKVTTMYANAAMQGFPSGRARYYGYRVSGGAPGRELLHWDSRRGNKRIG